MKLKPPASSSDIEVARQIARRLHQNRRSGDRTASTADEAPRVLPPSARLREPQPEPAWEPRPPQAPPARPAAHAPALHVSEPLPPASPAPEAERDEEIEVGALTEPEDEPQAGPELQATFGGAMPWEEPDRGAAAALDDLDAAEEPPAFVATDSSEPDEPEADTALAGADVEVDVDVEEPPSQEQLVGEAPDAEDASPLDRLGAAAEDDSPFDDSLLEAPPAVEALAPPSWEEVVETCREVAQAKAAMLVDPAGQVFAARGDWPAPGPDAIAAKLVAMMAKTLKDAPTRSISAPLMGMHLTAWRVPLAEGLVTAAFIGAAAVRSDIRPAIDQAITAADQS